MARKLACAKCGLVREHTADRYGLKVVLPTKDSSTLDELLKNTRTSNLMDDHVCPTCKTKDTTTEDVFVNKLPKYLIVQAPRARHMEGKNKHPVIKKIKTLIKFPAETLDLSPLLCGGQSSENYKYEVFGAVEHVGNG